MAGRVPAVERLTELHATWQCDLIHLMLLLQRGVAHSASTPCHPSPWHYPTPQGDGGTSFTLNKMHLRQNNQMRHLKSAFAAIGEMCAKLNQSDAVKNAASEIYKNVRGTAGTLIYRSRSIPIELDTPAD